MLDLVGNPEDWFSRDAALMILAKTILMSTSMENLLLTNTLFICTMGTMEDGFSGQFFHIFEIITFCFVVAI